MGRLFRPFDRLDADPRGTDGVGLGRARSSGLVELMGGSHVDALLDDESRS
jgi:hypothetical protein